MITKQSVILSLSKDQFSLPLVLLVFVAILFGKIAKADDATPRFDDSVPAEARIISKITFKKIDFNNNTLGEMVIKLNAMIRDELKDQAAPTVMLNLKGLSESEITKTLNRKIVNCPRLINVPFYDTLAFVAQFTNCSYEHKGLDIILTPHPPYVDRVFDVDTMIHPARSAAGH